MFQEPTVEYKPLQIFVTSDIAVSADSWWEDTAATLKGCAPLPLWCLVATDDTLKCENHPPNLREAITGKQNISTASVKETSCLCGLSVTHGLGFLRRERVQPNSANDLASSSWAPGGSWRSTRFQNGGLLQPCSQSERQLKALDRLRCSVYSNLKTLWITVVVLFWMIIASCSVFDQFRLFRSTPERGGGGHGGTLQRANTGGCNVTP